MQPVPFQPLRFEGIHCKLTIDQPSSRVVVMRITGSDVGEFGQAPMRALKDLLEGSQDIDLFIDASEVQVASIQVSGEWAHWLAEQKGRLHSVTMLTGSRFIQVTAAFVRRFAELQDTMTLVTDAKHFEAALARTLQ